MNEGITCNMHMGAVPQLRYQCNAHSCNEKWLWWMRDYKGTSLKKDQFFFYNKVQVCMALLFWTGQQVGALEAEARLCLIRPSKKFAFFSLLQSDLHLVRQSALFQVHVCQLSALERAERQVARHQLNLFLIVCEGALAPLLYTYFYIWPSCDPKFKSKRYYPPKTNGDQIISGEQLHPLMSSHLSGE